MDLGKFGPLVGNSQSPTTEAAVARTLFGGYQFTAGSFVGLTGHFGY